MTAPLDVPPPVVIPRHAAAESQAGKTVEGRSLGQIAWLRLRRDKLAMAGGVVVILLCLVALIGPYVVANPLAYHSYLIDPTLSRPIGPWGGISLAHPLGVEPVTRRDLLARVVNGAKWSLLIALLATILAERRERIRLTGELPSPLNPPSACRFHTRCWKAQDICRTVEPQLAALAPAHQVACHFPESGS